MATTDIGEGSMDEAARTLGDGEVLMLNLLRYNAQARYERSDESLGVEAVERHSELLPSGALVVAYGLLRVADAEAMARASEHLLRSRPDDPDVLAIGGEVAARRGDHLSAMRFFLDALTYGLPAFGFGLNYLVERMRLYTFAKVAASEAQRVEVDNLVARCRNDFEGVQAFAVQMDFEASLTCYEGFDPSNPLAERRTVGTAALISAGVTLAATAWLGVRAFNRRDAAKEATG